MEFNKFRPDGSRWGSQQPGHILYWPKDTVARGRSGSGGSAFQWSSADCWHSRCQETHVSWNEYEEIPPAGANMTGYVPEISTLEVFLLSSDSILCSHVEEKQVYIFFSAKKNLVFRGKAERILR